MTGSLYNRDTSGVYIQNFCLGKLAHWPERVFHYFRSGTWTQCMIKAARQGAPLASLFECTVEWCIRLA